MNWDEAIEEAKEELGISGYTDDWDEVVEKAKEILRLEGEEEKEQEKQEFLETEKVDEEDVK